MCFMRGFAFSPLRGLGHQMFQKHDQSVLRPESMWDSPSQILRGEPSQIGDGTQTYRYIPGSFNPCSALNLCGQSPDRFCVVSLTDSGRNTDLQVQTRKFQSVLRPESVWEISSQILCGEPHRFGAEHRFTGSNPEVSIRPPSLICVGNLLTDSVW